MTVAARTARIALWQATSRLHAIRRGARSTDRSLLDHEIASAEIDLRVLDPVLVLLVAAEQPALDELRAIVSRARVIAQTLGPLFA